MARKKGFALLGHSIGEGFAGASPMFQSAPWLADAWHNQAYDSTPGHLTPLVQTSVYENIFIWTAKSGWPLSGGTPPTFTPGAGQFLELNVIAPTSPNFPHPYSSPFNYPNTRTMPTTPTFYNASTTGGRCQVGVELPLAWRLVHYWVESCHIQKLCIPSTLFLRHEPGAIFFDGEVLGTNFSPLGMSTHYSWFTPADQFDFDPSSDRLYATWIARMTAGQAELALAGDKQDIRFVVLWLGDNDATLASTGTDYATNFATSRVKNFESYYRAFIERVRADLVANDWTSLPKHKIPVIGMGIFRTYGATIIQNAMAAAMNNIAADDPYFTVIPTRDMQTLTSAGFAAAPDVIGLSTHLSHNGYLEAADSIFDAYVEIENLGDDPLANENRVTVEDVMDRVGIYYERNRTRNDATTAIVLQHINAAMFHIINRVSDSAWWIRRVHPLSLSGGPTTAFTLPKFVHRILRIERTDQPGYPLQFQFLGYTDGGRMQIVLKESYTGTHNVHFITQPKDLTRNEELIPLPYNLVEWLVVEATRRLARSSGNIALQTSLASEANELMADCMRNINAVRRPAMDRLAGQRRLPTRRSYRRRWWAG